MIRVLEQRNLDVEPVWVWVSLQSVRAGDARRGPRGSCIAGRMRSRSKKRSSGAASGSPWPCSSIWACTIGTGHEPALEFLTGYLIEKALSVDNIFVFLLIFSYFRVPALYQHADVDCGIDRTPTNRAPLNPPSSPVTQRSHHPRKYPGSRSRDLVCTGPNQQWHHAGEYRVGSNKGTQSCIDFWKTL